MDDKLTQINVLFVDTSQFYNEQVLNMALMLI